MELFPQKQILVILKKRDNSDKWYEVKRKKLPMVKESYVFKGKEFYWSLDEIRHTKGNKNFIYKDFDNGNTVLQMGETGTALPPDGIRLRQKEKLAKAAIDSGGTDISTLTLIFAAVGCLALGMVIMTIAYPSIFPQMMKQTAQPIAKALLGVI